MCGAEEELWEETVSFLCWGHLGQPHVALSFNILQFKYGVLESGLFSEFFKEEGTYGQIDGLSLLVAFLYSKPTVFKAVSYTLCKGLLLAQ